MNNKKQITLVKTNDFHVYSFMKFHKDNGPHNQVFTDGIYQFHLNESSEWKVLQVSYDYGETWEFYRKKNRQLSLFECCD